MKNFISLIVTTVLLALSNLSAGPLFVCPQSTNPVPPFADWATAATNIQQAVNAAAAGDEIVVTNGIYGAVNVDKPLFLRSVNGPQVTIVDPLRQSRCAYLANGTSLAGFWLRRGTAGDSGGGALCASSDVFITNCVITENISVSGSGGGVYGGTLYNCLVSSNSAGGMGGGAIASTLYNCTVTGNHAGGYGGGVYSSAATNCILYLNTSTLGYGNHNLADLNYCCTTPMPTSGVGNMTNAPQFVNYPGGDLRLLGISPCVNAGDNNIVRTGTDLAGYARIMRGTVDLGAYEFQGTNSMIFYAWVQHHGIVIDGTTDYEDPDGDGLNNWQEWVCYACPTNRLINLRLISVVPVGSNVVVRWESSPGVKYFVERTTNPTSSFTRLATNLVVNTGEAAYTNFSLPGRGPFFYRVGVTPPSTQPPSLLCPVAAKPADPSKSLTYEGQVVSFCCDDCKAVFEQDPTPYLLQIGLAPPPSATPGVSNGTFEPMSSSECALCDLRLRTPQPKPCPSPSPAETSPCCKVLSQPNASQ